MELLGSAPLPVPQNPSASRCTHRVYCLSSANLAHIRPSRVQRTQSATLAAPCAPLQSGCSSSICSSRPWRTLRIPAVQPPEPHGWFSVHSPHIYLSRQGLLKVRAGQHVAVHVHGVARGGVGVRCGLCAPRGPHPVWPLVVANLRCWPPCRAPCRPVSIARPSCSLSPGPTAAGRPRCHRSKRHTHNAAPDRPCVLASRGPVPCKHV